MSGEQSLALPVAGVVAALAALVFCVTMTPSLRLAIAAFLAMPQFFLPGAPLSLAQAWLVLVGLMGIVESRGRGGSARVPATIVMFLAGFNLFAWTYSPDPGEAVFVVVQLALFGAVLWYTAALGEDQPDALDRALKWMAPWMVFQAALVIWFRLSPDAETKFLQSATGDLLVGPAAAGLFGDAANNVLDPAKAGGLIVNGNSASMLLGVCVFTLLVLFRRCGRHRYAWAAAICWVAVLMSGSKTGIALAITLPIAARALTGLAARKRRDATIVFLIALIGASALLPSALTKFFPTYVKESETSLDSRGVFWAAAWELFQKAPWFGLGFGGWTDQIRSYVGTANFPPHNLIVAAWASAGVMSAALTVLFILAIVRRNLTALFRQPHEAGRGVLALATAAWLWIFIHGMGDNTAIYGERHSMLVAAILLGYLAYYDKPPAEEHRVKRTIRPHRRSYAAGRGRTGSVGDVDAQAARAGAARA